MSFDHARPVSCTELFEDRQDVLLPMPHGQVVSEYVEYIVFFSGGKDSIAAALHLLDLGVKPSQIEINHHLVDGKEGSTLMDWPVTADYCRKFAEAFGMRYVETWREGGFEGEMMRDGTPTAPIVIPGENGELLRLGGNGPAGTRLKFPQVSADLRTRWCSGYVKVDVGSRYLVNHPRFSDGRKRLVITGERAEESPNRARYASFEAHADDNRHGKRAVRHIDHWRPVHAWREQQVWAIMERYRVNPHPAYRIGFSRCSCMSCIFIANDNWATIRFIAPPHFNRISDYEKRFGVTIHRSMSVEERADKGSVMPNAAKWAPIALATEFTEPIIVDRWELPAGAYQGNGGCF